MLTQSRSIHSMRSLRPSHLSLLKKIRRDVEIEAMKAYGIEKGELRMFVHYQPTYCMYLSFLSHSHWMLINWILCIQRSLSCSCGKITPLIR